MVVHIVHYNTPGGAIYIAVFWNGAIAVVWGLPAWPYALDGHGLSHLNNSYYL